MKQRHILPHYRIAVVGTGAVGGYYGAKLAHMGRDVHFLLRSDLEYVRKRGLRIRSKQGDFHLQKVQGYGNPEEIGPVDVVIIALKATQNEALETLIPPLLKENTTLITLQNGLGNEAFLAERFGADRVVGGLCFVCLNRTAPGEIQHLGHGLIVLGEYGKYPLPRTHDLQWEFKRCGVVCQVAGDLGQARWRKLVWNIPFNGLSIAAGGVDVGHILADDDLLYLTRQLMREIIQIARTLGHEIPESFVEDQIRKTKEMGAYLPSSLIDYQKGKPVEVEAIWGEPYRQGFNAGAEVGRLEMLYHQLKRMVREKQEQVALSGS